MFCQMKAGTLNTKKLDLPLNSPVSKLFSEAASFSASSEERLELSYQGKILRQGNHNRHQESPHCLRLLVKMMMRMKISS